MMVDVVYMDGEVRAYQHSIQHFEIYGFVVRNG